jgi:hypothetical protein
MTWNAKIQLLELILMIIEATQTNVEDNEDVIIIPIEEKVMNLFQTLDQLNPPKVNKKRPNYVTRGKNKKRALNSFSHLMSESQLVKKKVNLGGKIQRMMIVQFYQHCKRFHLHERLI